jgi:hypothetical protein
MWAMILIGLAALLAVLRLCGVSARVDLTALGLLVLCLAVVLGKVM